jgi:hypothetical protein
MFKGLLLPLAAARLLRFDPLSSSCYTPDDNGASYRGLVETTSSGRKCMRWTEVEDGPAISDSNGLGNHGYCRNPDGQAKPYCHPMDTPGETEECNIEECAPDENADKYQSEAAEVKTYVSAQNCECAAQLYGDTTTTADTSVPGALLTIDVIKKRKITMAQVKQLCKCQ